MARNIVGVIIGIFAAGVIMWTVQSISNMLYPLPAGVDPTDIDQMKEHMKTLPIGALIIVLTSHFLGALGGAWIGSIIADKYFLKISLIIAGFLLVMGIINLLMIPHPVWFAIVDIPLYALGALCGYQLYIKMSKS